MLHASPETAGKVSLVQIKKKSDVKYIYIIMQNFTIIVLINIKTSNYHYIIVKHNLDMNMCILNFISFKFFLKTIFILKDISDRSTQQSHLLLWKVVYFTTSIALEPKLASKCKMHILTLILTCQQHCQIGFGVDSLFNCQMCKIQPTQLSSTFHTKVSTSKFQWNFEFLRLDLQVLCQVVTLNSSQCGLVG